MQKNERQKIIDRLNSAETLIKEARDLAIDSETAVESVVSAWKDFSRWAGLTADNPTAEEVKVAVKESIDKAADVAVEKTAEAAAKVIEKKTEDVKATQTEEVAKAAIAKTKDEVVKEVKDVVADKKEEIKKQAIEVA